MASITDGWATRYPTRAPANEKALLIVRITTTCGYFSIRVMADASSENSAYASSTTSSPGVLMANFSISSKVTADPVGLLGVVINVKEGFEL